MRKYFKGILIGLLCFVIAGCSTNENSKKVASIPLCNVQEFSYYTNDPRTFEDDIPNEYTYYGKINQLEEDKRDIDLSTNYEDYLNKEVYFNKSDDNFIYIKYDSNKFLKLHHDDSSE